MDDDDTILPRARSAGHEWRERFHAVLDTHGLDPASVADALLTALPTDPVGVFRAIAATLPKEVDVRSETQTNHLVLMQLVGRAQEKGLDLSSLLSIDVQTDVDTEPEWLK